jgi:hypothetical protein
MGLITNLINLFHQHKQQKAAGGARASAAKHANTMQEVKMLEGVLKTPGLPAETRQAAVTRLTDLVGTEGGPTGKQAAPQIGTSLTTLSGIQGALEPQLTRPAGPEGRNGGTPATPATLAPPEQGAPAAAPSAAAGPTPAGAGGGLVSGLDAGGNNVFSRDGGQSWTDARTGQAATGPVYSQTEITGGGGGRAGAPGGAARSAAPAAGGRPATPASLAAPAPAAGAGVAAGPSAPGAPATPATLAGTQPAAPAAAPAPAPAAPVEQPAPAPSARPRQRVTLTYPGGRQVVAEQAGDQFYSPEGRRFVPPEGTRASAAPPVASPVEQAAAVVDDPSSSKSAKAVAQKQLDKTTGKQPAARDAEDADAPPAYVKGSRSLANPNLNPGVEDDAMTFLLTNKMPQLAGRDKESAARRRRVADRAGEMRVNLGLEASDVPALRAATTETQKAFGKIVLMDASLGQLDGTIRKNVTLATNLSAQYERFGKPFANTILNAYRTGSGSEEAVNMAAQLHVLAQEWAKAMEGGAMSAAGVHIASAQEAEKLIDASLSHNQLQSLFKNVLIPDLNNRQRAVGDEKDRLLNQIRHPERVLGAGAPAAGAPPGAGGGMVKMRAPGGQTKDIPADQVDYYKRRGATVVQ